MSLLEDIFLQDEADEAQELERVIEGDEYDERPRSRAVSPTSDDNEPKEDEAEEDKRRVDPTSTKAKRVTKNPRFLLNPARLTGPRGIQVIPEHFKDFKFKGKGHEKEDLDLVLKKLEHWAYRLYPKFQFEDCLKKIETLGKKRPVMVHLHKIRTDQFLSEETVVQKDSSDEETQPPQEEDEFDKLLQQQIDLARATPAPGSVKKTMATPATPLQDRSPFTMPKATSSPSISDEQKERMIRNRQLAEERRLARLKQNSTTIQSTAHNISGTIEVDEEVDNHLVTKKNRSNVIDSSDDDCDVTNVQEAVMVDVHGHSNGASKDFDEDLGKETDRNYDMEHSEANSDVIVINDVREPNNVVRSHNTDNLVEEITDDYRSVPETEIIDIHDAVTDSNPKPNVRQDNQTEEIIEIKDQTETVNQVNDKSKEIVVIDDENNTNITENDDDDVIEINDAEENVRNNTPVTNQNEDITPGVEDNSNKSIERQSIEDNSEQNVHEDLPSQNIVQEIQNLDKDTKIAEEVLDDMMDVDFSEDF
ncbi:chromosome segregation in meiosis protein 3 [Spodoptera litura]|uniref:TIMELESS-interacting protein n=1 Tax=Spodoptera litura TaxID=69820 RepID=A0A9J7J0S1_SPOLT|nr:chromosome segregation in meiosis protein 3 [Spodoptera litura]